MKHKPYVPPSSAQKNNTIPTRENVQYSILYSIIYTNISAACSDAKTHEGNLFLLCVDSSNILLFGTIFFVLGNFWRFPNNDI